MEKSTKVAGVGCGAVLALMVGCYGWISWETRPQPPDSALPPLVRGSPSSGPVEAIGVAFKRRVQARFPVGSDENEITKELEAEGFAVHKDNAYAKQTAFPCLKEWSIRWDKSGTGKMTAISAVFQYTSP